MWWGLFEDGELIAARLFRYIEDPDIGDFGMAIRAGYEYEAARVRIERL